VRWTVTFFSSRVETKILSLPAGLLARFLRYAERIVRKSERTPRRELEIARTRLKDITHG
jgi:hypothetical protein